MHIKQDLIFNFERTNGLSMKKTITNETLSQLALACADFLALKQPTDFKLHYAVSKSVRDIQRHFEELEALNMDLVKRYCKKNEDGTPVSSTSDKGISYEFEEENAKLFTAQSDQLYAETIELEVHVISPDDIKERYEPAAIRNSWLLFETFVQ